jgi:hypothetical protein
MQRCSPHQAEQAVILRPGVEVSRSIDRKVKAMPLMQVFIALIVVGVLLWLVNRFIPMAGSIKSMLNALVVICGVVSASDDQSGSMRGAVKIF